MTTNISDIHLTSNINIQLPTISKSNITNKVKRPNNTDKVGKNCKAKEETPSPIKIRRQKM